MKRIIIFVVIIFVAMGNVLGKTELFDLRVEHLREPLGLSATTPRLSWKIKSDESDQLQTAYQVLVASSPRLLTPSRADLWNSEKVHSGQNVLVEYAGRALESRQQTWWQVRIWDKNGRASAWSAPARFEMGLLSPGDWGAEWIKTAIQFDDYLYPSPMFRTEFLLNKPIQQARLYATSKGLYEFYLNGDRVGDDLLTPGFTSYKHRIQYQVYDVTHMINRGNNAAGIILGNGWYRAFNPNNRPMPPIQDLKVLAQLEVLYSDGSRQTIVTGPNWRSATGPVLVSTIFDGETYDARLEMPGWNKTGFDDSSWHGVVLTGDDKDHVVASLSEPVRRIDELTPIEVIYTPEGDTVIDMGQNMVGWCRLAVDVPEGTSITLRHAEILDMHGNFYTENLRTAKQEVTYISNGRGMQVFEPRFTFQGFRYVAISGYPGEVTKDLIKGIVIHSDLARTGTFSCNNDLINQLQHNIIWGQKGNFVDIPTDCPQRNERLGWTGDVQVFAPTSCFNMGCAAFYTKWLKDLIVDQHDDGAVPWVIPNVLGRGEAHGWADAALIVPWNMYLYYGDVRILEEQYESMKAWVEYVRGQAGEDHIWRPRERQFGDWLAFATIRSDYPGATTDKDLTATAYFYHSADLLQKTASILGRQSDENTYRSLKARIKEAFNNEYVTPNGRLSSNTQTAYVVALIFGLIPEEMEAVAAARLAADVNSFGHITTGFLGTADICHVLTKHGYLREAYKLLYRTEYPSWLYPVTKDATTIWERWDGIKPDGTLQNPGMNSYNHFAYGAVGDWLYRVVAGIRPDPEKPGFKNIIIKPQPGGEMNDVKASHESPYGTIRSEWMIENGTFTLSVSVPANTTANVFVPSTANSMTLNGKTLAAPEKLEEPGLAYHFLKTSLGSGNHTFNTGFNVRLGD